MVKLATVFWKKKGEILEIHFKDFGVISSYRYVFIDKYAYVQHSSAEWDPSTQMAYIPLIQTDCLRAGCLLQYFRQITDIFHT